MGLRDKLGRKQAANTGDADKPTTSTDTRPSPDLETTIATGLASLGDVNRELARWVLTGTPQQLDLSGVRRSEMVEADHYAMMDAVRQADPIVEWRLGILLYRLSWLRRPSDAVDALGMLRQLPDDRVTALLAVSDFDDSDTLRAMLEIASYKKDARKLWRGEPFARLVRDHPDVVRAKMMGDPDGLETVADAMCAAPGDVCGPFAPEIAELATSSSKKRRAAGLRLAMSAGYDAMAPEFRKLLTNGSAAVRAEAIPAWAAVAGDQHRSEVLEFCQQHCADDRSAAVRDSIAALAETQSESAGSQGVEWPAIDDSPPTDVEQATFQKVFEAARANRPGDEWQQVIRDAWAYTTTGDLSVLSTSVVPVGRNRLADLAGRLRPLYVFRLLRVLSGRWNWTPVFGPMAERFAETGYPSLLEVQAAAEYAGLERQEIIKAMPRAQTWSDESTAEWVLAVLPDLISVVDNEDIYYIWNLERYYEAFATVSPMPSQLRQYLIGQAVGSRKGLRPLARTALRNEAGVVDSAIELLSSRKYEERAEAANWLAELGATEAAQALHTAAAKESHDIALGAELTALEQLGESIDAYLDPDALIKRGAKDLKKGMPADAAWLQIDVLPELRWADGSSVDRRLVDWLVVQAVRLKSATPSPIVSRLYERMEPRSVTEFANAVFTAWMTEDLMPASPEEVRERAKREIRMWRYDKRYDEMSDDELTALMVSRFSTEPAGSATSSKGLLSLVAAGADLAVVQPTESYLRKWYGRRASQAKALVEMLGWIDDPAAIQLLLSVGNRFRTQGIQEEALRQAELVAERKGWTLDDLAYRTVPTGGFDADGKLTLDYGDRTFQASLTDDLKVVLTAEDGKTIKALPAARASDDEDQVKLAKKELTDAKKHVSTAAKEQPVRLQDAMCLQRRFELDDFERYVLGHPVMSRLATRLVWASVAGSERTLFRPLTDGTLLDAADDEIDITEAEFVTLAHEVIDGTEAGERWRSHFSDYKVKPLFEQFGRPPMPDLADGQTELTQWLGTIIDDRQLRSVIKKVHFTMGRAEDAGMVPTVDRRFVGADLEALLSTYGLYAEVMEKNVALQSLRFERLDTPTVVPLAEVPPVLLVETIANVEQIVAAGDGVDPDWEKRAGW